MANDTFTMNKKKERVATGRRNTEYGTENGKCWPKEEQKMCLGFLLLIN